MGNVSKLKFLATISGLLCSVFYVFQDGVTGVNRTHRIYSKRKKELIGIFNFANQIFSCSLKQASPNIIILLTILTACSIISSLAHGCFYRQGSRCNQIFIIFSVCFCFIRLIFILVI